MREVIRSKKTAVLGSGVFISILALALFAWSPGQADAVQETGAVTGMEMLAVPGFLDVSRVGDDDGWCELPVVVPSAPATFLSAYSHEPTDDPAGTSRAAAGSRKCWDDYMECLENGCFLGYCSAMYKLCQVAPPGAENH